MAQHWMAHIHPIGVTPTPDAESQTLSNHLSLSRLSLYHDSDTPVHHWEKSDWTLVVIGVHAIKEDFLTQWRQAPMRAAQQLPESWILIAIDHSNERCWCGRDGLGFANAYWRLDEDQIWLSDSLTLLNKTAKTPPQLAEEHLSEFLSFRYNHAPRTLFKNRYALISGHFTIFNGSRVREEQWYKPNWYTLGQKIPTEREAKLEVDYLLRRSLEPHLFSQQKFGVLLSGLR